MLTIKHSDYHKNFRNVTKLIENRGGGLAPSSPPSPQRAALCAPHGASLPTHFTVHFARSAQPAPHPKISNSDRFDASSRNRRLSRRNLRSNSFKIVQNTENTDKNIATLLAGKSWGTKRGGVEQMTGEFGIADKSCPPTMPTGIAR
jgi:hypothetical protein